MRRTPEDSWLMPPAEAREMTDVDLAYGAFVYLIQRYPDSYHALRARYQISAVVQRRCRNHMYVADYYHKRETPAGVMQRIEQGLSMEQTERAAGNLAPSMPCVASPRSMLMLAEAYVKLDDPKGFWSTLARTRQIWFPDAQQRNATLTAIQEMANKKGWQQPDQP